jgi:anhydro-N-acetylmuramic acid kinase
MQHEYIVYGLMSGTSLDGVDIAACAFKQDSGAWQYEILYSETITYTKSWLEKLLMAPGLCGEDLISLDREYGNFLGDLVNKTIGKSGIKPFLIASHGHTVFHSPDRGFTLQIGSGAQLAVSTGIPVACDFRSTDVAAGGQGAPLVPIGDKMLFSLYDACLNLGGFANISFELDEKRIAFDICPVNFVLNRFANQQGEVFDRGGVLGRKGLVNDKLLQDLNDINYYYTQPPKSLSREWVKSEIDLVLGKHTCTLPDTFRTMYEHIAIQISKSLNECKARNVILTGGGTYNNFLIELLRKKCKTELIIPDRTTIDFKEALIFAFMGLLRFRGEVNCLSSVTGAVTDLVCGAIYLKKESGL